MIEDECSSPLRSSYTADAFKYVYLRSSNTVDEFKYALNKYLFYIHSASVLIPILWMSDGEVNKTNICLQHILMVKIGKKIK